MTQQDRNDEQQRYNVAQHGQNVAQQIANEDLAPLIRELTLSVTALSAKFRRSRVERAAQWCVTAAVVGFLLFYFAFDLPDRRQASYETNRDLVCFATKGIVPGLNPRADALRDKYDCPPFNPADVPKSSPQPTATRTVRGKPGATKTVAAPGATSTATVTRPGSTRVLAGATRTVTRTATRTVRATVTRTVTAPPSVCVVRPICIPLGEK